MKPIPSTTEILAYKVLNRNIDEIWIRWAVNMLMAGFDTEHLVELAGASVHDSHFELQPLTTKALDELNLDYTDKHQIIRNYVSYLILLSLDGITPTIKVLKIFYDIYFELDEGSYLEDFAHLYYAKEEELLNDGVQWYFTSKGNSDIDSIIHDYFVQWLLQNPVK
ncbi:hypothetical protein [Mucilaginibacter sp. OK283]|jgi:hypothetical protein|uniref:hypothetical protein n=1 Tax=Mucilaginibacter sp. OK283 TaxID=1881049 RepID=UPI0008B55904|nr:hypothetical protein [Mucilaginibacter sp. OK283]SEO38784.1 hypothetical protein SAMN05428947_102191 [Mucilaginibacter sp. OK283]